MECPLTEVCQWTSNHLSRAFLGREGPCIQIGACIGQGFAEDVYHYQDTEERDLLIKCGIAAGLSAAFSAPITGTVFLLGILISR